MSNKHTKITTPTDVLREAIDKAQKLKPCPWCNGRGITIHTQRPCSKCNETGKVKR